MEKNLKIILVNYRYFISGGPERYLFNIKDVLESKGHEVIPFSVKHNLNVKSKYDKYFLDPIGSGDEITFGHYRKGHPATMLKTFERMFYSFEARRKLSQLIGDVSPDVIYVLQYQSKISPSIIDVAKDNGIPVIQRISDFGHICANSLFFQKNKRAVCEKCLNGTRIHAIINKCVYDSYVYSLLKVLSLQLQEIIKIHKKIDQFVVPSKIAIKKLKKFGIPEQKLNYLPTFFPSTLPGSTEQKIKYGDYALYIGRIDVEKGILTLIKAFENTNYKLKIIGFSTAGYEQFIKEYLSNINHNVEFLGKMNFEEIKSYLSECLFTVVPSECYENFPNTVLESYAFRKPVVASAIGSLREIVVQGKTGLLFEPKNIADLSNKIKWLFRNKGHAIQLGEAGYHQMLSTYSPEYHYHKLKEIFLNCL